MSRVTIVVTNHLKENEKYLDLALLGIQNQTYTNWHCVVISDAETMPLMPFDSRFTLHHDPYIGNATNKAHYAVDNLVPEDSDLILFHSDDVFMSEDCVKNMVKYHEPQAKPVIINPCSNSDLGSRFAFPMYLMNESNEHIMLHPDMSWEDICPKWIKEVGKYSPGFQLLGVQDYVSFYCTMIPKEHFKAIGRIDARLDVRHNDEDYCIRARQRGIIPVISFDAFALHFGSKTLYKAHSGEEFNEATKVFKEKWGR